MRWISVVLLVAVLLASPSVQAQELSPATRALAPEPSLLPLNSREFFNNWRDRIGQRVTLTRCALGAPGPSGIQCTLFSGPARVGYVMLLSRGLDPGSEFWARENCEKPAASTICSVKVSGVVSETPGGVGLTGAIIRPEFADPPAPEREKLNKVRRRGALPYIRAASSCIAQEVAVAPDREAALKLLASGADKQDGPLLRCLPKIEAMVAAYDRIYGPGTGQPFYEGPYIKDLPRAVTARLVIPGEDKAYALAFRIIREHRLLPRDYMQCFSLTLDSKDARKIAEFTARESHKPQPPQCDADPDTAPRLFNLEIDMQ
uniref:hypothetical protein n=1 Tax=Methylobacterium nigriterrae TaxID=3127512 RepID=UPI00301321E9